MPARTGFYTDGRLYSMSNALEFLRFPPLGLIGKVRLAATILHASRVTRLEAAREDPGRGLAARWSGNRTFEKIWLPLLRAKLGENYTRTSAAFIWATIAEDVRGPADRPQAGDVRLRAGRLRPHPGRVPPTAARRPACTSSWG